MKSWKKLWKDDLDKITPPLRDDVKNASIPTILEVDNNGSNTATATMSRQKKWVPITASITALTICLLIILCVCLIMQYNTNNDYLVTLEINPTVTFATDKNGVVTGVIASNSDADIIFADKSAINNIKGKSIENATTYVTDYAAKLGYLDLNSSSSAVRISGFKSDEILGKVQNALEDYFTAKGVFCVVIAESVSKGEFAKRSSLKDMSAKNIEKYIKDNEILFCDREAQGLDLQSIQSLYNQKIVANKLFDYVNNNLLENLERIIKNAQDIEHLSQLYNDILHHEDNPLKLLGDYWIVKIFYGSSIDGEFAELMQEMEIALDKYKSDYGVDINSVTQLQKAASSYLKIPAQTLTAFLENLSLDIFQEFASDIFEIMEMTGIVSEGFAEYLQLPQSIEDYIQKTLSIIDFELNSRLEKYKDIYNQIRQPIEKADYLSFVEGIAGQYGSLDNFWEHIKN